jgi:nucleotide-binding universal stress UspA family protein
VLESDSPAAALVDYARTNNVEQILIGAPPVAGVAPWRATVASQVMVHAPCSVTVVRPRAADVSPVE